MNSQVELPQYQCHKIVRAAKITEIRDHEVVGQPNLILGEIGGQIEATSGWHAKHKPEIGGYYVVYADGYKSFSPALAFEEGYTPITQAPIQNTVTLASIIEKIRATDYTVMPDGRTTVCQLTMENGFTVLGFSACVSKANYDQVLGEKFAHEDALSKVWPYEGYLLAEQLHRAKA